MTNPLVGSTVKAQVTVTNPDTGVLTDGTVTLAVTNPDNTTSGVSPTNPSTGIYSYNLMLNAAGWWTLTWTVSAGGYTTVTECQVCAGEVVA